MTDATACPTRESTYCGSVSDLSWPAIRFLGRGAVRGHLDLTDTHLKFRPGGIAKKVEGTPFAVQFKHIAGAGLIEDSGGLLRRRRQKLSITLGDGSEHFFFVQDPDAVATSVRERLGGAS